MSLERWSNLKAVASRIADPWVEAWGSPEQSLALGQVFGVQQSRKP